MFDPEESGEMPEDNDSVPILEELITVFNFASSNGQRVKEHMTIRKGSGVFGNMEPTAHLKIYELGDDGSETLITETDMPLGAWTGRVLAVFRKTTIAGQECTPEGDAPITVGAVKYKYIFKREF